MKPGRNKPCPCGSGLKYKYCCIDREITPRIVNINKSLHPRGVPDQLDMTNDIMNLTSGMGRALQHFCKDNGIYFFESVVTIGKLIDLNAELKKGTLTKLGLIEHYKDVMKKEVAIPLIEDACDEFTCFAPRRKILNDACEAHFEGKYTLSVPVLFAQVEGLLRNIGALKPGDDIRPTIKSDIWDNRMLFAFSDNSRIFNGFLQRLYAGQTSDTAFNRNPVLHGINVSYDSEEYSLILILTILEIRTFLWFEKNTQPFV